MNIYVHTPREWFELYQLGKRQFGCFIGHTSRDMLEERFDDGDYSHFIEVPQVLRKYEGLHEEITDHWIHDEVIAEGWHQYNKLCKEGRSPDFFVTDKDPETALQIIDRAVHAAEGHLHIGIGVFECLDLLLQLELSFLEIRNPLCKDLKHLEPLIDVLGQFLVGLHIDLLLRGRHFG